MRVILPSGRYLCREENSKWSAQFPPLWRVSEACNSLLANRQPGALPHPVDAMGLCLNRACRPRLEPE